MYLCPLSFFCSFIIRVTSKMFSSDTLRRILNWNQDPATFYYSISAENIFMFSVALGLKSNLIQQLIKSPASSSCILPSLKSVTFHLDHDAPTILLFLSIYRCFVHNKKIWKYLWCQPITSLPFLKVPKPEACSCFRAVPCVMSSGS